MTIKNILFFLGIGSVLSACNAGKHYAHLRIHHSYQDTEIIKEDHQVQAEKTWVAEEQTVLYEEKIPVETIHEAVSSKQEPTGLKKSPVVDDPESVSQIINPGISTPHHAKQQRLTKEQSGGSALGTILVAILLFLLALVFLAFLGAIGLVFFIIFIIAAVILLIVGLIALL